MHDVDLIMAVAVAGEGEAAAVGRPGRPHVQTWPLCQSTRIVAVRFHDIDVVIAGPAGAERDPLAVGREGRPAVEAAAGEEMLILALVIDRLICWPFLAGILKTTRLPSGTIDGRPGQPRGRKRGLLGRLADDQLAADFQERSKRPSGVNGASTSAGALRVHRVQEPSASWSRIRLSSVATSWTVENQTPAATDDRVHRHPPISGEPLDPRGDPSMPSLPEGHGTRPGPVR